MNPPILLLGVDGGGTSTEAWIAEPGGRILGRGSAGPSNAKAVGLEASGRALELAIANAFLDAGIAPRPADVACLGIAGFGRPDDREVLARWSDEAGWCRKLIPATDGDLVVAAGTPEGWGVGVIAGTGSIAVARGPDGRTSRAGGWGFLMGDEGSAYAVVLEALKLIARRADGRLPSPPHSANGIDPLSEHVLRSLNVAQVGQIISKIHAADFDRSRIAALAPAVLMAADEDPEVSTRILKPAGSALAEMARAAAEAINLSPGPLPLAVAGGFLLGADEVFRRMIDDLNAQGYDVNATRVAEPVRGAIVLAERAIQQ